MATSLNPSQKDVGTSLETKWLELKELHKRILSCSENAAFSLLNHDFLTKRLACDRLACSKEASTCLHCHRLLYFTLWRTVLDLVPDKATGLVAEDLQKSEFFQILRLYLERQEDKYLVFTIQKIYTAALLQHSFQFAVSDFVDYLMQQWTIQGVVYLEICRDLLSKRNKICGSFLACVCRFLVKVCGDLLGSSTCHSSTNESRPEPHQGQAPDYVLNQGTESTATQMALHAFVSVCIKVVKLGSNRNEAVRQFITLLLTYKHTLSFLMFHHEDGPGFTLSMKIMQLYNLLLSDNMIVTKPGEKYMWDFSAVTSLASVLFSQLKGKNLDVFRIRRGSVVFIGAAQANSRTDLVAMETKTISSGGMGERRGTPNDIDLVAMETKAAISSGGKGERRDTPNGNDLVAMETKCISSGGKGERRETPNDIDLVQLQAVVVLCLKICTVLILNKPSESDATSTDDIVRFIHNLDTKVNNCLGLHSESAFDWLPHLYGNHDADWVEVMLLLLELSLRIRKNSGDISTTTTGLEPHRHFLQFMEATTFDHSIFVDLITSPETLFLTYFMKYLKFILSDWNHFQEFHNFWQPDVSWMDEKQETGVNVDVGECKNWCSESNRKPENETTTASIVPNCLSLANCSQGTPQSNLQVSGSTKVADGLQSRSDSRVNQQSLVLQSHSQVKHSLCPWQQEVVLDQSEGLNSAPAEDNFHGIMSAGLVAYQTESESSSFSAENVTGTSGLSLIMGSYYDDEDENSDEEHREGTRTFAVHDIDTDMETEFATLGPDTEDAYDTSKIRQKELADESYSVNDEVETCSACTMDRVMSTLIRVKLKIEKLCSTGIIPYNPTPLLQALSRVEYLYEHPTD